MEKRNTIITIGAVSFILFIIFTFQIIIFSGGKTKKNNLNIKESGIHQKVKLSEQNYYKKNKIETMNNTEKNNSKKTFPQSLYENKKNLNEIKAKMAIVNKKVHHMQRLRGNVNAEKD